MTDIVLDAEVAEVVARILHSQSSGSPRVDAVHREPRYSVRSRARDERGHRRARSSDLDRSQIRRISSVSGGLLPGRGEVRMPLRAMAHECETLAVTVGEPEDAVRGNLVSSTRRSSFG
jgi:hypothetical protein